MSLIMFRIMGYVVTMILHITNATVMINSFHGEVMKNYHVSHYYDMTFYFFTCWTFTFQIVYAGMALYCEILTLKNTSPGYRLPKILDYCRNTFFTIVVWPSSMLVFVVFWSFFAYDRNLLYPEDIDLAISSVSNHIMHTSIMPIILWEVLSRARTPPRRHKWYLLGIFGVEAAYIAALLGVYWIKGVWVYPIFGLLINSIYFYLFFVGIATLLVVIYHSQWWLNDLVWGSKVPKVDSCQMMSVVGFVQRVLGYVSGSKSEKDN